jgi:hypothetical protein
MHFVDLPVDVFTTIHFFFKTSFGGFMLPLIMADWKNLMDTCKFFTKMKKETCMYRFNPMYSLKYIVNQAFHELVRSKIHRTVDQLLLTLDTVDLSDPSITENFHRFSNLFNLQLIECNISDLKDFHYIGSLWLKECRSLQQITSFDNETIKILSINGSQYLEDGFSYLKNKPVHFTCSKFQIRFPSKLFDMTGSLLCVGPSVSVVENMNSSSSISTTEDVTSQESSGPIFRSSENGRRNLRVTFFNCPILREIINVSDLEALHCHNCPQLLEISDINNIKKFSMMNVSMLYEFDSVSWDNVDQITIINASKLHSLSIKQFTELRSCHSLKKVKLHCSYDLIQWFDRSLLNVAVSEASAVLFSVEADHPIVIKKFHSHFPREMFKFDENVEIIEFNIPEIIPWTKQYFLAKISSLYLWLIVGYLVVLMWY